MTRGVPGWLSRYSTGLLISGSGVQAPCWAYSLLNLKKKKNEKEKDKQ